MQQKQQTLRTELGQIRQQQQGHKDARAINQRKIDDIESKLKARIEQQKESKKKVPFKNVEELDAQIKTLQSRVDTGTMKLVDEKKALAEISSLNRIRKNFSSFAEADKAIADLKTQVADMKKSREDPEVKALSDRYTAIQKELDTIKAEQDELFKNKKSLFDDMGKARDEHQKKWVALKQIKDSYYQASRAFKDYERQAARQRAEKRRQERDEYEAGKRREVAKRKLEEASQPAYQDEILTAQGLIRYFDPSSAEAKEAAGPGKFAAVARRTVDAGDAFKGMKVVSKKGDDDNAYFVGGGGKKKKGKKAPQSNDSPAPPSPNPESKFNLPLGVIEELARIGVEPPMGQSDVSAVVEKIKGKLDHWKKDQARKTKEVSLIQSSESESMLMFRQNIDKAQKEIDRLEAEHSASTPANANTGSKDTARKPAEKNEGINGHGSASTNKHGADVPAEAELAQEKDAVADAAAEMEKAKIEDAEEEES